MSANRVLQLAAVAGRIVLENGGEVYRVEETANRICASFGVENSQCYATPTALIVSAVDGEGETHSVMERITARGVNLDKIDAVNRISREFEAGDTEVGQARAMLEEVRKGRARSNGVIILFSALACAAFALVFQGDPRDILPAFLVGALVRFAAVQLSKARLNDFFVNVIGGFLATAGGWLLVRIGLGINGELIIISALMLLVPGLLLTNAVRDVTAGDLISGISRLMEAFFVAVAIACGATLTYVLIPFLGGGSL